jgi:hypothetical protein
MYALVAARRELASLRRMTGAVRRLKGTSGRSSSIDLRFMRLQTQEKDKSNVVDAFMDELAARVAARVVEDLRRAPVIRPRLLSLEDAGIMMGRSVKAMRHLIAKGALKNASPDDRVQVDIKRRRSAD